MTRAGAARRRAGAGAGTTEGAIRVHHTWCPAVTEGIGGAWGLEAGLGAASGVGWACEGEKGRDVSA
jgi:hypothetical protein